MLNHVAHGHFSNSGCNTKSNSFGSLGVDARMHDVGRPARFLGQPILQGSHSDLAVLSWFHGLFSLKTIAKQRSHRGGEV